MAKKIIIALALIASVAAVAVPSFAALFHSHDPNAQGNSVCVFCNGTGRSFGPQGKGTGPFKCGVCNGTGFRGSY